ncbi:alpha/beta fold hydrolase [Mucilaginibacter agri]|uniref:Alpha/beta fold hydrolase n=1 Tax=Mucilaginibacter agri TaxID=2695265 RepID=A0A966DTR5_9SPHI|nr:alpha/beta hydrolase [Mucilaginibacter agri]NCD69622.1 alpha/beta fold hydrolase [Mucilaginibacter agri]
MNKIFCILFTCCMALFACSSHHTAVKPKIANNGVNIAYIDTGKGDTTLLFVHGWCINKGYWHNQTDYFSKNYRVVAIDLPGFGQSGKNRTDWSPQAFGKDVNAVMTELDLKNVVLIGHSMAGDIVVQAAANDPKRVIALVGVDNFKYVGIAPPPTAQANEAYDKAIDSLKHHFTAIATEYINEQLFSKSTPDSIKKRVINGALTCDSSIAAACMQRSDLDDATEIKKAGKKLYLINSDPSPTAVAGMQKKQIPFRLFTIKGTGHYPMLEAPAEFNRALAQAINSMHVGS